MKNNKPKLSILIPTYNRENFISQAIESVLNQPFQDFEIICSDNASQDNTVKIIEKYAEHDNRIKIYCNESNLGPVLNWKNCLDHASGDFVHWLWSDDWIEKDFYQDAFSLMEKDGTRLVSTWNYRSDNPNDTNEKYVSWRFSIPSLPGEVAAKKLLLFTWELPVSPAAYILPMVSVRKFFFTNIPALGELDPVAKGVGVDSLMVVGSCMAEKKISVLQKPSVVFRNHENISTVLSRDGSLSKMYYLSHLWYMVEFHVPLTLGDFFRLFVRTMKVFRIGLINYNLLKVLFNKFTGLSRSNSLYKISDGYKSRKVLFK